MSYWESFFLGLVQGLGEFLPISSSAHLVVLPWFVQFEDPGLAFSVALHLGTLVAVLAYFYRDWMQILLGTYRFWVRKEGEAKPQSDLLLKLILATVPAAIAGLLLDDWAETAFRNPLLVAFMMVVMGVFLFWADRKSRDSAAEDLSLQIALLIGLSQALALIPGVSRSGITITTALFCGLSRSEAARFSFLLSTPIILGACVLKAEYFAEALFDLKIWIGVLTAMVVGFLSIKYLMKLIRVHSFAPFCYYRFAFGAFVLLVYLMR